MPCWMGVKSGLRCKLKCFAQLLTEFSLQLSLVCQKQCQKLRQDFVQQDLQSKEFPYTLLRSGAGGQFFKFSGQFATDSFLRVPILF